jgi:hypothetical protein
MPGMRATIARVDLWAAGAAILAAVMTVAYVAIIVNESGEPAYWFISLMAVAIACATYGCAPALPLRRVALAVCAALLTGLGFLAILTIGLPVLVAGVLAWIAFARAGAIRA